MNGSDAWDIIRLALAGGNPIVAEEIKACTYTQIAFAWQNNRRSVEGVGYRIKERKK